MTEPDLFVVCKNCSSEVSPYVTECPYCGQRVRKRAPKLDKGEAVPPRSRRVRAPSLPRLRRDEIPGIAADTRPYATFALIALSLVSTILLATDQFSVLDLGAVVADPGSQWWRVASTPFVHGTNIGYLFIVMVATAVFGTHLERRFGFLTPVLIFLLAGAAGAALAVVAGFTPALGANGAALGLLTAWLVEDRRAAARGEDRESDILGTQVFAAVLILLPLAEPDASLMAGIGGVVVGVVAGLGLATFRR